MKCQKGQKNGRHSGLTTYMFESLDEVNAYIKGSPLYKANKLPPKLLEDLKSIRGVNGNYNESDYQLAKTFEQDGYFRSCMDECIEQTANGIPALNDDINKHIDYFKDLALEIEPSLTMDQHFTPSEEGAVYDEGAIAAGEANPFFSKKNTETPAPKPAKSGGAFRFVINTDVASWQDPAYQAGALGALALIVQKDAPVEIWIQQGWLGGSNHDGITLFPVHKGGPVSAKTLAFWVGSLHKDSPYSWCVNRLLGRTSGGVSLEADIPCDLYIYNQWMPYCKFKDNKLINGHEIAEWVAKTSKKMLFEEEDPSNFGQ